MTKEKKMLAHFADLLEKYRQGKRELDRKITSNEKWWKMRYHSTTGDNALMPNSAWLFNSIANKHADAMDSYPEPCIIAREECDKNAASALGRIIPAILDRAGFEKTYSNAWWYKLKNGTACYGVFWNPVKDDGKGSVEIRNIDLLDIFWEPGVKDIQSSRAVFYLQRANLDSVRAVYPDAEIPTGDEYSGEYRYGESRDDDGRITLVDCYYKTTENGTTKLNLLRFTGSTVLYSSESDKAFKNGFYAHGLYPFVMDTMYCTEDSVCGFGCVDVMKDAQMYIDRLGQVILEHTVGMGRKRFFIRNNSAVNEAEFADMNNTFVHVAGSLTGDDIREINLSPLDGSVMMAMQSKIEELKETSGNRDFSQGGTANGVTAASAIAALQETGSKLSRDMIKNSYIAFAEICRIVIELIRQFCITPRSFFTGEEYTVFDGRSIRGSGEGELFGVKTADRKPDFDVCVKAAKRSPFSKTAQNELVKELYSLGFFEPANYKRALVALSAMDFEGKQEMMKQIKENGEAEDDSNRN